MDNLATIISLASAAFGLLVTVITFVFKLVKAIKAKNYAEAKSLLEEGVKEAVEFVETVKSKSQGELDSTTKKTMALTKINQYCIDKNIAFNAEQASTLIEEMITYTKKVNARDKDKVTTVEV